MEQKFGKEATTKLELSEEGGATKKQEEVNGGKVRILEVWDRRTKKVTHYSEDGSLEIKSVDDPLKLKNFFPCLICLKSDSLAATSSPLAYIRMVWPSKVPATWVQEPILIGPWTLLPPLEIYQ